MSILGGWTCNFRVKKIGNESLDPVLCKSIELIFRDSLSKIWSIRVHAPGVTLVGSETS